MRYRQIIAEAAQTPPETPWDDLKTGQPALFYAWRGVGGGSTPLSPRWQAKFGRKYLLGDGIYVAPTKHMATRFGEPQQCRVVVANPYVLLHASGNDLLGFDLDAIRQEHDAVVILSGRAAGNEDMRQACIWPEHQGATVEVGIAPPTITTLQPGAKVRVLRIHPVEQATRGHLVGMVGTVISMTLGHPNVRFKGERKSHFLSRQDVEIIP